MAFKHLTQHLLGQLLDEGKVPSHETTQRLLQHIVEECPQCRVEYDLAVEAIQLRYRDRYSEEAATIISRLLKLGVNFSRLRQEADEEYRELLQLNDAERMVRVSRALRRFRSPFLVETLLSHTKHALRSNPFEASVWAELAHAVTLRIPQDLFGGCWSMTSVARTKAYRGNALRVQGKFTEASPLLEAALLLFRREGDGDPLVEAEMLALLGTLRKEQQRHPEAAQLLTQAELIYQEVKDPVRRAKVLLVRASLSADRGVSTKAITLAKEAVEIFAHANEHRLHIGAIHNLAHYLRDDRRFQEAHDLLLAHAEEYQELGEPLLILRLAWLSATITHGLGQLEEAASSLVGVRERLLARDLTYDAALAGLDLALILLEQGRTSEIRLLAEEIVPVFLDQEIEREALAAVILFKEAAIADAVTEAMLLDLSRSLGNARCRI